MGFFETLRDSARSVIRDLNNIKLFPQRVPRPKKVKKRAGAIRRRIEKRHTAIVREPQLEITEAPQEPTTWEEPGKTQKDWNEELRESAKDRTERVLAEPPKKKRKDRVRLFPKKEMPAKRRHLLFMNPGTTKILQCTYAIAAGDMMPVWATPFAAQWTVRKGRLYFQGLPMATKEEKRELVKKLYFNPKEPSTIVPITDVLRDYWANISRKNVSLVLRSLETYQINFQRRLPPKVLGRMIIKKPGTIACDAFFPSRKFGWVKVGMCLTMMDVFSRYCWIYSLEDKRKETVRRAMEDFFRKFASKGWRPLQGISDKGTDLSPFAEVFEKYRGNKVGPLVFKSVTGAPVLVVENLNAQVQRRMEVFRTANITDDPAQILEDISYQINHQKRPDKQDLTPVQILNLNEEQIKTLFTNSIERTQLAEPLKNLKKLRVGDSVRVLLMDRKSQVKGTLKGFQPKWSTSVHSVLRIVALRKNPNVHRFHIGSHQSYFRHELLWIPKTVDRTVPRKLKKKVASAPIKHVVNPDEDWSAEEYDSDDSRA